MRRVSTIVLGAFVLAGLMPQAEAKDPVCLEPLVLAEGQFSGYDPSPTCEGGICPGLDLVIQDAADFVKLWNQVSGDPAPTIDFRTQVVIATFMGKRPNTSYTTNIDCVSFGGIATIGAVPVTVSITDSNLGAGCIVSPAIVNPYEIVVFNRPTNALGQPRRIDVTFAHTTQVTHCNPDDPICRVCLPGGGIGEIEPDGIPCCP